MAVFFTQLFLAFLSLSWLASAAPVAHERRLLGLSVTAPSNDSFYLPPAGYEKATPGTILASRQVDIPAVLEALTPGITKSVWQLLYRSTDSAGNPNAVITTFFVPVSGDTNKLFTQAIAYDAADVDCSPSYQLRSLTNTNPDVAIIALGLYSGWYVQSPDFETYAAAFGDGVTAGQAMLDSLRASLASTSITGLSSTARVAMNGGSGGALSCEWAMELQQSYAPELTIAGATLGSLTPNVKNVYNTINGGVLAGLAPTAIIGLTRTLPALREYMNENLVPETADAFLQAGKQCLTSNQVSFAGQNISLYFKNPNFFTDAVPADAVNSVGVMGLHGVPQVPFYVYKGQNDEVSAVGDTDALVEKYCQSGVKSLIYVRNLVNEHETESIIGIVGAYAYISDRLNGIPVASGCAIINSTKSSLNASDSAALGGIGSKVINVFDSALSSLTAP